MWIIEDWAGIHLFPNKDFQTFEDGWDFLLARFPDADLQDHYVVLDNTSEE